MKTIDYKVVEIRGAGIEYDYQSGIRSIFTAHVIMNKMNWRATTNKEEFLQNGDGNPYCYVIRQDEA